VKLNAGLFVVGVTLVAVGVALAVGVGWGLAVAGVPLAAAGLLRDDGRPTA
jgi:hypothetical protein